MDAIGLAAMPFVCVVDSLVTPVASRVAPRQKRRRRPAAGTTATDRRAPSAGNPAFPRAFELPARMRVRARVLFLLCSVCLCFSFRFPSFIDDRPLLFFLLSHSWAALFPLVPDSILRSCDREYAGARAPYKNGCQWEALSRGQRKNLARTLYVRERTEHRDTRREIARSRGGLVRIP